MWRRIDVKTNATMKFSCIFMMFIDNERPWNVEIHNSCNQKAINIQVSALPGANVIDIAEFAQKTLQPWFEEHNLQCCIFKFVLGRDSWPIEHMGVCKVQWILLQSLNSVRQMESNSDGAFLAPICKRKSKLQAFDNIQETEIYVVEKVKIKYTAFKFEKNAKATTPPMHQMI